MQHGNQWFKNGYILYYILLYFYMYDNVIQIRENVKKLSKI